MSDSLFNNQIDDAQGTMAAPVDPASFDIARYTEYEAAMLDSNRTFWEAAEGIAVYRRFRVPEVFSYSCADMKLSLALQLGALAESMKFKADIANFLEPWYGIGTIASAFGLDYHWLPGQAPATKPPFADVKDALAFETIPIEQTSIGKRTLEMIEYFLQATGGRIPMSLTDTQSPLDTASYLVESNSFFTSFIDDPDQLKRLLDRIAKLLTGFTSKQLELIGDAIAWPGHGFASSRCFSGLGASDDVSMMLSAGQYTTFGTPFMSTLAEAFGAVAFHSCGNWSGKIEAVRGIPGLVMVDGAFSAETDPHPNPAEPFGRFFAGTGTTVNARMVGSGQIAVETCRKLWRPGVKMIAVTYCKTPEEQAAAYDRIHELAG